MRIIWKTNLTFLMILLICSITPAVVVQVGETDDSDVQAMLNSYDKAANTELTPEQAQYLDEHMPLLQNKGENILNNLQEGFNYLIEIYNEYHTVNNTKKRSNIDTTTDKYTKSLQKITNNLQNTHKIPIETQKCTYKNLTDWTNKDGSSSNVGHQYDKDKVIVQIKDPQGYTRYMKLIDINDENIVLESGNAKLKRINTEFVSRYVWSEDGSFSNSDHEFNIIIVPTDGYTDDVLTKIWLYQDNELTTRKTNLKKIYDLRNWGMSSAGMSVIMAAVMALISKCSQNGQQDQQVRRAVRQDIEQAVAVAIPEGHVEQAQLLQQDGLKRSYGATQASFSSDVPDFNPSKKRISKWGAAIASVLALGTLILISSLVAHFVIPSILDDIDDDQANLREYKPSLFKINQNA